MMCVYCKGDDAERIDGVALCPSCRARFSEAHGGGSPACNTSVVPELGRGSSGTPRAVRPQSLADERHQQAFRLKERLR